MKSSAEPMPAPPELEAFLFAEIGREENGMALTVASAFARLGLDPWQQAAMLARLPEPTATASLASAIGRLHGDERFPPVPIARRLVLLLPRGEVGAAPHEVATAEIARTGNSLALWLFWAALAAITAYLAWF